MVEISISNSFPFDANVKSETYYLLYYNSQYFNEYLITLLLGHSNQCSQIALSDEIISVSFQHLSIIDLTQLYIGKDSDRSQYSVNPSGVHKSVICCKTYLGYFIIGFGNLRNHKVCLWNKSFVLLMTFIVLIFHVCLTIIQHQGVYVAHASYAYQ